MSSGFQTQTEGQRVCAAHAARPAVVRSGSVSKVPFGLGGRRTRLTRTRWGLRRGWLTVPPGGLSSGAPAG